MTKKRMKKKCSMAIKPEGGGGKGLNGPAIKRRAFFAASLTLSVYPEKDL